MIVIGICFFCEAGQMTHRVQRIAYIRSVHFRDRTTLDTAATWMLNTLALPEDTGPQSVPSPDLSRMITVSCDLFPTTSRGFFHVLRTIEDLEDLWVLPSPLCSPSALGFKRTHLQGYRMSVWAFAIPFFKYSLWNIDSQCGYSTDDKLVRL